MKERIAQQSVYELQPAILKSLVGLGQAALLQLEPELFRLVTLRASQINGCAFCLHMHLAEARQLNISQDRIDLINMWREVPLYNLRERAALHWVEVLTLVAEHGVSETDFAMVAAEFSNEEIVNLTAAIVTINSWNRIAVGLHFIPDTK